MQRHSMFTVFPLHVPVSCLFEAISFKASSQCEFAQPPINRHVNTIGRGVANHKTNPTIFGRYPPQRLPDFRHVRSEEHTSELQSQSNLVCRLLLEKKKKKTKTTSSQ